MHSVAISLDDTLIASGSADGNLQLWPGPGDVTAIICSKLTTNASREQWKQWVGDEVPFSEPCERLKAAPDA